jgi:hypothetical protein
VRAIPLLFANLSDGNSSDELRWRVGHANSIAGIRRTNYGDSLRLSLHRSLPALKHLVNLGGGLFPDSFNGLELFGCR